MGMPLLTELCGCFRRRPEEVRELDYRHCSLRDVPGEVFTFERTLEELHLDSNQVCDLPVSLFHCHSLKHLGLSDNELQTLPPAVASLIHLHVLDVSKNAITTIPDNINGCKQLRSVDASVNPLARLPDGFTQLLALQELYLNDTFLEYLPANFGRLSRLRVLELRENRLTSLPKSMSRLTHLQRLDLGQNDLSQLPEVVGSLTALTELLCDFNKISRLPALLGQLTRLQHLDASNNKISFLADEIGNCTQLVYLQLSANNLRTLPESCSLLTRLITLKVDDNTLTSVPENLGHISDLEELMASHNDLTRLPPSVGLLRRLTDLNLDNNLLLQLPPELGSCTSLRVLSVRSNRLTTVPAELGHLSTLRVLNLCSNRISHLPCSFTKLHNLQALWLSPNQNKPLVRLQSETLPGSGQRVLTCFMLPQHDDPSPDDDGDCHDTLRLRPQQLAALEADLAARSHIKFAFDHSSEPTVQGRLLRAPTPYPKELRELAKHARNLQKLERRPEHSLVVANERVGTSPPPYHIAAVHSRMAGEFAAAAPAPANSHHMLNMSLDTPSERHPPSAPLRLNETFDLADLGRPEAAGRRPNAESRLQPTQEETGPPIEYKLPPEETDPPPLRQERTESSEKGAAGEAERPAPSDDSPSERQIVSSAAGPTTGPGGPQLLSTISQITDYDSSTSDSAEAAAAAAAGRARGSPLRVVLASRPPVSGAQTPTGRGGPPAQQQAVERVDTPTGVDAAPSPGIGAAARRSAVPAVHGRSTSRIPVSTRPGQVAASPSPAARHGWPLPPTTAGWHQMELTIEKNPGLGFSIAGGSSEGGHSGKGVYISRVHADSPAWGVLRPGDLLQAVDDCDLSAASHEHAVNAIVNTGSSVRLRLLRPAAV
ncbi:Erbin [Amphibalanus amphitrite]|uniref:Erbin n=1 Tax=Amphibalanus amphitrite TaxID=1232801 RepID=A0A6A4WDK7_AMPAM|nr:Erbin [Amphibalanus amphitrite]